MHNFAYVIHGDFFLIMKLYYGQVSVKLCKNVLLYIKKTLNKTMLLVYFSVTFLFKTVTLFS